MLQPSTKSELDKTRQDEKGDPLGIVQEIEICTYNQIVFAQTGIHPRKWDAQNSLGLWDTIKSPNPSLGTRPSDSQRKH